MAKAKSTETSVDRTIAPQTLIKLIRRANTQASEIQTLSGEMGEEIKSAIENKHLHRGAFNLVRKLAKMDDLKRKDFIRQIGLYIGICQGGGLFGPEHAGDLADEAERISAEGDGEPANGNTEWDEAAPKPEGEGGEGGDAEPLADAAARGVQHLAGMKTPKPPRGRRGGLDGGEAEGGTRIQ
jgi:hypothetical protein